MFSPRSLVGFSVVGLAFLFLGFAIRGSAHPSLEELEDRLATSPDFASADRADVAEALSLYLKRIKSAANAPEPYAGAVQCFMILGAKAEAVQVLREGRERFPRSADLAGVATAWKLDDDPQTRKPPEPFSSLAPVLIPKNPLSKL